MVTNSQNEGERKLPKAFVCLPDNRQEQEEEEQPQQQEETRQPQQELFRGTPSGGGPRNGSQQQQAPFSWSPARWRVERGRAKSDLEPRGLVHPRRVRGRVTRRVGDAAVRALEALEQIEPAGRRDGGDLPRETVTRRRTFPGRTHAQAHAHTNGPRARSRRRHAAKRAPRAQVRAARERKREREKERERERASEREREKERETACAHTRGGGARAHMSSRLRESCLSFSLWR